MKIITMDVLNNVPHFAASLRKLWICQVYFKKFPSTT